MRYTYERYNPLIKTRWCGSGHGARFYWPWRDIRYWVAQVNVFSEPFMSDAWKTKEGIRLNIYSLYRFHTRISHERPNHRREYIWGTRMKGITPLIKTRWCGSITYSGHCTILLGWHLIAFGWDTLTMWSQCGIYYRIMAAHGRENDV